jgi:hypothetical protein
MVLEEASLVVDVVVLAAVAVVLAVLEAWALTELVVPKERPRPS